MAALTAPTQISTTTVDTAIEAMTDRIGNLADLQPEDHAYAVTEIDTLIEAINELRPGAAPEHPLR